MKKSLIITCVLALSIISLYAQTKPTATSTKPENKNAPVMTFDASVMSTGKPVYNYGTIQKGADGRCVFIFKNNGKEPLIITNTKSSCGCTVPSPPKYPILPGHTDSVAIKYNTKRLGKINKSVTITSNAKNSPIVLRIKGNVIDTKATSTAIPTKKGETGASATSR